MSKKKSQLDAVNNFANALHAMRCSGVQTVLYHGGNVDKIILLDRETGEQMAEYAMAEALARLTGQVVDEFATSTNYFGDLAEA